MNFWAPGYTHDRASRSVSRQFSQLCPSRVSTKRVVIPVDSKVGTIERLGAISGS